MQARALAFLIPEDGVDPKLTNEWRAKIICACALDAQFREAFFAELHQVMAKIEALAAALRTHPPRSAAGLWPEGSELS